MAKTGVHQKHEVNAMSSWWQSLKDALQRYYDDEEYTPSKKSQETQYEELTSREAMRISPLEKPSQIAICIPETPDEEWRPADYIKSDRPVIVNFKKLDSEDRDQVRNFLIGVIYALDGTFTKLSEDLFLFAPSEVGIITKHGPADPLLANDFFSGELNPEDLLH